MFTCYIYAHKHQSHYFGMLHINYSYTVALQYMLVSSIDFVKEIGSWVLRIKIEGLTMWNYSWYILFVLNWIEHIKLCENLSNKLVELDTVGHVSKDKSPFRYLSCIFGLSDLSEWPKGQIG